jgi:hypothetical protein
MLDKVTDDHVQRFVDLIRKVGREVPSRSRHAGTEPSRSRMKCLEQEARSTRQSLLQSHRIHVESVLTTIASVVDRRLCS